MTSKEARKSTNEKDPIDGLSSMVQYPEENVSLDEGNGEFSDDNIYETPRVTSHLRFPERRDDNTVETAARIRAGTKEFSERRDSKNVETPHINSRNTWFLERKDSSYSREKVEESRRKRILKNDDEVSRALRLQADQLQATEDLNKKLDSLISVIEENNRQQLSGLNQLKHCFDALKETLDNILHVAILNSNVELVVQQKENANVEED